MQDTPQLGLPLIEAAQAQKHVTHNEAIVLLDALAQIAVETMAATSPPADPPNGARLVIGPAGEGVFAGRAGQIALRDAGAWRFLVPRAGWLAWSVEDGSCFVFDGAAWVGVETSIRRLQNLERLGVGTTADDWNRLAVKLNAALFTALTTGEGGSGDLRFTLNKESTPGTVSQLYQTNWSGRAETGLMGDDHYRIKVSPDGSVWVDALEIDNTTGQSRHVSGTAAAPGVSFIGDTDTGLSNPAADAIGLVTGGVERARMTSAGNFGFGTTNPQERVHVEGNIALSGGNRSIINRTAHALAFGTNNAERMRITSGGDLVVGHAASIQFARSWTGANPVNMSPRIQAIGDEVLRASLGTFLFGATAGATSKAGFTIARSRGATPTERAALVAGDTIGGIDFVADDGAALRSAAMILAQVEGTISTSALPGRIVFSTTGAANNALAERMRISSGGNVGVGTATPTTTLHVNGPIRCGSFTRTTLPSASAVGAGTMIWVSNPQSGAARAFWSTGAAWRDQADVEP